MSKAISLNAQQKAVNTVPVVQPAVGTSAGPAAAVLVSEADVTPAQYEYARQLTEMEAVKQDIKFAEVTNTEQYLNGAQTNVTEIQLGDNLSGIAEGSVLANYYSRVQSIFPGDKYQTHALAIAATLALRGFGGSKKDFRIRYNNQDISFRDLGFRFNPGPYDPTMTRICRVLSADILRVLVNNEAFEQRCVFWQKIKGSWKFEEDWVFCFIGAMSLLPKDVLTNEQKVRCAAINAVLAMVNRNRTQQAGNGSIPINKWNSFMRVSGIGIDEVAAYLNRGLLKIPSGAVLAEADFVTMIERAVATSKNNTDAGFGRVILSGEGGKGKQKA